MKGRTQPRDVSWRLLISRALLLSAPCTLISQIVLPNQSAVPGAVVLGPVEFAPQASSVSGVQFDVEYDNAALSLVGTVGEPARFLGKNLYSVDLAPNKKRFLIIGINQSAIPNGALVNFSVSVSPAAVSGVYSLAVSNVSGTDPAGGPVSINGSYGTIAVNSGSVARLGPDGVLNAGSFLSGPVAPGELVTLMGSSIGPASPQIPSGAAYNTVLGGTSVFFDGVAAPLLYAAPNQINAIVPYSISGETATQMTVTVQGRTIAAATQPVAPAAPAIFALDSRGAGPGAILNQDSSVNSSSNPAAKESVIAIYATGAGLTNPASVDGQVTGTVLPAPVLPVSVQVGGLDAKVVYAGAAPGLVSGVLQINAVIPSGAPSGTNVPLFVLVGAASSQMGVTVAIR